MPGSYQISLAQRYADVFGLVVRNVVPRLADVGIGVGGSIYVGEAVESYEGTPVLDEIKFRVRDNSVDAADFLEHVLEIPAMIRYSREKLITETILNRDFVSGIEPGLVVESSGWSPWDITVQGFLINQDNHLEPPLIKLDNFRNFLSYHKIYDVVSHVTNALDVGKATIRNKSFNQVANWPDTIAYTLNLRSHESPQATFFN